MILVVALFGDHAVRGLERCKAANQKPGYATSHPNPGLQSVVPGQSRPVPFQSIYKQLSCEKPGNDKEYELCQQWRSAEGSAQQACVAELQFWIGGWISIFGLAVLALTVWLAGEEVRASKESNDLTRRAMVLDHRPWISLDMKLKEPLTNDATGAHCVIRYTLKNVGKAPAMSVDFMATMIPWGQSQPAAPGPPGYTVAIPIDAINAAIEETYNAMLMFGCANVMFPDVPEDKDWRVNSGPVGPGFIAGFFIIGCVAYTFPDDPNVHRTVRIYELRARAYGQMLDLSAASIPNADLYFVPHGPNGSRAT